MRLYPRAFRDRWAEEAVLVFADLSRQQPPGAAGTLTVWAANLPDLVHGMVAEWWREFGRLPRLWLHTVGHGAAAGALLSTVTAAGNLGQLWSTPAGRVANWLISAAAVMMLARTGRSAVAVSAPMTRALRHGLLGGLVAFVMTNLTATVIVVACFDRLRHDPLQIAAFAAGHESDFRTYQIHDLLGGWIYGTPVGAMVGALSAGAGALVSRISDPLRRDRPT